MIYFFLIGIWRKLKVILGLYDDKGRQKHSGRWVRGMWYMTPALFYSCLADDGWQVAICCMVYKCQILSLRTLTNHGRQQYHIRLYEDGYITGHYEFNYEFEMGKHLRGESVRDLTDSEWEHIENSLQKHLPGILLCKDTEMLSHTTVTGAGS